MRNRLFPGLELLAGILLHLICFAALWGIRGWNPSVVLLIVLYPLGSLFIAAGLSKLMKESETAHFWHDFALCTLLPFYGSCGIVLMTLYRALTKSGKADHVDEAYEIMHFRSDDIEEDYARAGRSEKILRRELWVQSYFDIMRGPDKSLKKTLISKILKEWTPNGVKLLKMALEDSEYDIRSYAATGLSTIEEQMASNLTSLRRSLSRDPENPELLLNLAEAYMGYLRTGIIDMSLGQEYLRMSITLLDRIEGLDRFRASHDQAVRQMTLRALIASFLGDTREEEGLWRRILEFYPDNAEALGRICEMEFRNRKFASLRKSCAAFSQYAHPNSPFYESVQLVLLQTQLDEEGLLGAFGAETGGLN